MNWAAWIRNASLGLLAVAVVDFFERKPVPAGDWDGMAGLASRWVLGAALAAAYARLVPAEHWGVQSGISFAQLPVMGALRQAVAGEAREDGKGGKDGAEAARIARSTEVAVGGGLTGMLIRLFGAVPDDAADSELVLRMPKRV